MLGGNNLQPEDRYGTTHRALAADELYGGAVQPMALRRMNATRERSQQRDEQSVEKPEALRGRVLEGGRLRRAHYIDDADARCRSVAAAKRPSFLEAASGP